MLKKLGKFGQTWASSTSPWTNVYGLARTLLALGTLSTLVFSHSSSIFAPAVGVTDPPVCVGAQQLALFCQFPEHLELARWIAVALLLVVASGWRPRITGILHWWVAFSLFTTGVLVDGGDQATAVLTLLLVPVTLTDGRRWHWQRMPAEAPTGGAVYRRLLALSSLLVVRLQVAGIYFHAAVGKVAVEEWGDGTAMYYWLSDPGFGTPDWLTPFVMPVLTNPVTVVLLTWSVILFEILLFMGLVMEKRYRGPLLVAGIVFHAGIAVFQGLASFAFAMWGALILFLRPVEAEFEWRRLVQLARRYVVDPVQRVARLAGSRLRPAPLVQSTRLAAGLPEAETPALAEERLGR